MQNINYRNKYFIIFFLILFFINIINISGDITNNKIVIGEEKRPLVDLVVITNDNWVDCLAATSYAYENNGVILQNNKYYLSSDIEQLVSAINPKKIVIVGGPEAISYDIENKLKEYGKVSRIWGLTRIETNNKLIDKINSNNKNNNNTMVYVNSYNFNNVATVLSNNYIPIYVKVSIYDPKKVVRFYDGNTVHIYKNNKLINTCSRNEIKELPGEIIVIKNIGKYNNTKYCYGGNITKFNYNQVNISNINYVNEKIILINKYNPSGILLGKYANTHTIITSNVYNIDNENNIIKYTDNPVENSIITTVNILVLKEASKKYEKGVSINELLDSVKTELFSRKIPVDEYNIPYSIAEKYILKNTINNSK